MIGIIPNVDTPMALIILMKLLIVIENLRYTIELLRSINFLVTKEFGDPVQPQKIYWPVMVPTVQ